VLVQGLLVGSQSERMAETSWVGFLAVHVVVVGR
jgi:hypothetical protein